MKDIPENSWYTPDSDYTDLLNAPSKFKEKEGGAKNTGKRTGVYRFEGNHDRSETILLKQGLDVGETIAEYIGGRLYQLTIPDLSAECIIARDVTVEPENHNINDLYVGSIYSKDTIHGDAFKVAGYNERQYFAGERARLEKVFGRRSKKESLIRKVISIDQEKADYSLSKTAPSVLWHGDLDFHTGNFVLTENQEHNEKFIKIDHGFSFFNFKDEVPNIFDPTSGKAVDFSFKRLVKGGKLVEFYPTNHFWDFAVETSSFYFNPHFVQACDDLIALDEASIRKNINQSLDNISKAYNNDALTAKALKVYGKRIGMSSKSILGGEKKLNSAVARENISNFMVERLLARQQSMKRLRDFCQKNQETEKQLSTSKRINRYVSRKIDSAIELAEGIRQTKRPSSKKRKRALKASTYLPLKSQSENYLEKLSYEASLDIEHASSETDLPNSLATVQETQLHYEAEVNFCKMLEQAYNRGMLAVNHLNELVLDEGISGFFVSDNGRMEWISREALEEKMANILTLEGRPTGKIKEDKILLSVESMHLIDEIKSNLKKGVNKPLKRRD